MLVELGANAASQGIVQVNLSPALFGITRGTNHPQWNAALRLYLKDQVVESNRIASEAGAGDQGEFADALPIIEAEALTSARSEITRVNEWMEVELITSQTSMRPYDVAEVAERAIRKVWAKIGLRTGIDILITVLVDEAVLPSYVDATGYVTLKKPFAKYCLPSHLERDPQQFEWAIQRLAACHAAAVLSNSMAPPWLLAASEALTDIAIQNDARLAFCSGARKWHDPGQLNLRLTGQAADIDNAAIDQAILVGRYLLEKKDIKTFRDLLTYHSPISALQYFVLLMTNDPTRDACKKLYGFAPEYLFEQALAACCK